MEHNNKTDIPYFEESNIFLTDFLNRIIIEQEAHAKIFQILQKCIERLIFFSTKLCNLCTQQFYKDWEDVKVDFSKANYLYLNSITTSSNLKSHLFKQSHSNFNLDANNVDLATNLISPLKHSKQILNSSSQNDMGNYERPSVLKYNNSYSQHNLNLSNEYEDHNNDILDINHPKAIINTVISTIKTDEALGLQSKQYEEMEILNEENEIDKAITNHQNLQIDKSICIDDKKMDSAINVSDDKVLYVWHFNDQDIVKNDVLQINKNTIKNSENFLLDGVDNNTNTIEQNLFRKSDFENSRLSIIGKHKRKDEKCEANDYIKAFNTMDSSNNCHTHIYSDNSGESIQISKDEHLHTNPNSAGSLSVDTDDIIIEKEIGIGDQDITRENIWASSQAQKGGNFSEHDYRPNVLNLYKNVENLKSSISSLLPPEIQEQKRPKKRKSSLPIKFSQT